MLTDWPVSTSPIREVDHQEHEKRTAATYLIFTMLPYVGSPAPITSSFMPEHYGGRKYHLGVTAVVEW